MCVLGPTRMSASVTTPRLPAARRRLGSDGWQSVVKMSPEERVGWTQDVSPVEWRARTPAFVPAKQKRLGCWGRAGEAVWEERWFGGVPCGSLARHAPVTT